MHPTALKNGKLFFDTYGHNLTSGVVVDIGAQDVNGSLRSVCPPDLRYVGVDFVPGKGVDVILEDPYQLPFEDDSVAAVISSSCFEHSEMFWLLFLEIMRITKPSGLLYLNVPSNGPFHRYPVDCWRFYPDSGEALVTWAKRNHFNPTLLESYTDNQTLDYWNDYVAVFLKDEALAHIHTGRMLHKKHAFTNGFISPGSEILNPRKRPQDQRSPFIWFKPVYWKLARFLLTLAGNTPGLETTTGSTSGSDGRRR